jgi:peptide subunit release factor 1 (eRF1)
MITRDQIHELAQFEDQSGCALSFYFQPTTPSNKAHREEAILTKDLAREVLRHVETRNGNNGGKAAYESARADLDRIATLSRDLQTRGNGQLARGVFACSARNFWREYDLPAQLGGTQLSANHHFHLKPLAHLLGAFPRLGVVLLDRHRARLFDLRLGELSERMDYFHALPHRIGSDGWHGYEAGHAERSVADEVRRHFKNVADAIKTGLERGEFEKWILACQDTHWPVFSQQLHSYASQALLGRFHGEVAYMSCDQIRTPAEKIFSDWQKKRRENAVHEAIDQARAGGRGSTGLRRVLRSLEMGEVQTLLIGERYMAQAVECSNCGHLDPHLVNFCPVCGHETRKLVDVGEAILPRIISQNIELFYVNDDPDFDHVGNIAALLRFRAEPVKPWPAKAAAASQVPREIAARKRSSA